MRRRQRSDFERLQESVYYIPSDGIADKASVSNRYEYARKLYPYMLIQDLHTGIMPIGGRSVRRQFRISLEPHDPKGEKVVGEALSPRDYYRDFASAVCDFVGNCAVELLIHEIANYEIVYLCEPKTKTIKGFELFRINPDTLIRRGNSLIQIIPDEIAQKLAKPQQVKLNLEKILEFSLPPEYRVKMLRMIECLGVLSRPTAPEFFMRELATGLRKSRYDVKVHRFIHNLALANVTKIIGWNARQLFRDEALEYYLIHRILSFEMFKIMLRDGILKQLNVGIDRAGKVIGFKGQIVLTDLPEINDVENARRHLKAGDATFKEILEPFALYYKLIIRSLALNIICTLSLYFIVLTI